MKPNINRERLARTFTELCEISSPSRKEGNIAAYLAARFRDLGADEVVFDDSASHTGSETGNLIVRFQGQANNGDGFFFSCHMDTVQPGEGVKVARDGDIFTSASETILGGDDKSGIAAILEAISQLKENQISHGTIEVLLTTCEEIGLLGAKHLDRSLVTTSHGYALDSTGIDHVIIGAPAANKFEIEVKGVAAHAGLCPEAGINALALAGTAISKLQLGRIDDLSTCNLGLIQGGVATNIVPDLVSLKGEVRSHDPARLQLHTRKIFEVFEQTVAAWQPGEFNGDNRPSVSFRVVDDYPALSLSVDSPVLTKVRKAAQIAGKELKFTVAGGGSDANVLCGMGLPAAIVATGMDKVHTVDERLNLNDLVSLTELVYALALADATEA